MDCIRHPVIAEELLVDVFVANLQLHVVDLVVRVFLDLGLRVRPLINELSGCELRALLEVPDHFEHLHLFFDHFGQVLLVLVNQSI